MTIQKLTNDSVALKSISSTIQVKSDGTLKVGDRTIEGPGEYDVAGVGAHVYTDHALFLTEAMRVTVVWSGEAKLESEEESTIDILVYTPDVAPALQTIIKEQDPRMVIMLSQTVSDEVTKQVATARQEASVKVTSQTLPAEDRQFIVLV
jgi:hypothetical protein